MTKARTWTKEQTDIFLWFAGTLLAEFCNLIVRARAGTGKTTTIIQAIIEHAKELSLHGSSVLYGCFNKKNQTEADGKLKHSQVSVKTWHSVGYGLLSRTWGRIQAKNWVETDRIKEVEKDIPTPVLMECLSLISFLKNSFADMPTLREAQDTMEARMIACPKQFAEWNDKLPEIALAAMQLALTRDKQGRISFDDMVWLPVALGLCKPTFDLIVADEAQDLNMPQLTMVSLLVKPRGRVCLVGDDKQAIYGFRGAVSNGLDLFKDKLKATELSLATTFRCPKQVVALAQSLVPDYVAHESNPEGEIETLPNEKAMPLVKSGDVILSRVNAPLMPQCLRFIKENRPARIEGKDIGKQLAKLVKSMDATDTIDLVKKLGVWAQTQIAKATGWNAQQKTDWITDQYEVLKVIADASDTVSEVLNKLETLFDDTTETSKPAIVLSSVHKAKGLEWPTVYLFRETFQRSRAGSTLEQVAEEGNILYVAITRAQSKLVMTNATPANLPI